VRILDRYVFLETAIASGAATGAFVFVLVVGNILQQVSEAVASGRVNTAEGIELIALLFPGVIPYALPMGLLTGVLLAFGRLSSQHELTAMKASGRSLIRIARPTLILAALLAVLSAWINLELASSANARFRKVLSGSARENPASIFIPGENNRMFEGVTMRASQREGDLLQDFWFWRLDSQGHFLQSIHAREARVSRIDKEGGQSVLHIALSDAKMETRPPEGEKLPPAISYSMAQATTLEFPATKVFRDEAVDRRKLRWLTTSELLEAMDKGWQVPPNASEAEIAQRKMMARTQLMSHLASAFSVFSLALLAVPLAVRVGRSETFVNASIALAVALSYYLISSAAAWVKNPVYRPDLLIWLPNLIVVAIAVILLRRVSRF
jgi:lipopolysaccharide export system permease protein